MHKGTLRCPGYWSANQNAKVTARVLVVLTNNTYGLSPLNTLLC